MLFYIYIGFRLLEATKKLQQKEIHNIELSTEKELLEYNLLQSIFCQNLPINETLLTADNKTIFLKEHITTKTLICRIFENSCSTCQQKELQRIGSLENEGIPIVIIASFTNKRQLKSLLKANGINSKYFNLSESCNLFPFDANSNDIYICLIDEHLKPKYIFIPVQNNNFLSETYLKYIKTEIIK